MRIGRQILAAALLALAGAAYAQDQGFYVGGGAGISKALDPADCSDSLGFSVSNCNIEDKKTGWKVFVGYQFNPYVAVEGGYTDLGKFKTSFQVGNVVSNLALTDHPTLYSLD